MSKKNPSHENKQINKVEEPITEYNVEKNVDQEEELHPVLVKLLEKSIKNHEEGNVISNEEAMRRIKERYPFLK
jgi:hypothetical protein